MQKIMIRVRGSLGLKLDTDVTEKGSAVIDTDSSATARVELAETLNNSGLVWVAADTLLELPITSAAKLAHTTATKLLRKAKAHLFIGVLLSRSKTI
ncbi:MAG: hypothetical protein ACMG6H_12010 [Acidobacteriota bacterium]